MSHLDEASEAALDPSAESTTPIEEEKVGYCKPPKATRFQKGQSGNPKGRPKGRKNWETLLDEELNSIVMINENGQRKAVTKLRAIVKQGVNHAITSTSKSTPWVVELKKDMADKEKEAALQGVLKLNKTPSLSAPLPGNTAKERLIAATKRLSALIEAREKAEALGIRLQ